MRANALLLVTAAIWGLAFVAQRSGMEHLGPYFFNALRFALGATSLLPIYYVQLRKKKGNALANEERGKGRLGSLLISSMCAGVLLFLGSSFQQVGLQYTTAGNAGFITGMYVIIVPILGLCMGRKTSKQTWMGAALALLGMYMLSIKGVFEIAYGDLLVFISAFFWAAHVHCVGKIAQKFDALAISIIQFCICALLSLVVALCVESIDVASISAAAVPLFYAGIFSVGVAYTLQVVAQTKAHPSEAAIILSFESVFAVAGGLLILGEVLSLRGGIGCSFMFAGMILSQLRFRKSERP